MKFEVTSDKKYLKLIEADELELRQIEITFTKMVRNYWILLKKNPKLKQWGWTGKVSYFKNNKIPIGLWQEVMNMCEKYNFECDIFGLNAIIDEDFDSKEFVKWQENFFEKSDKKPYDYQINTAMNILKYGWSSNELATSAGKTLIVFMVFAYLKTHGKLNRMLIIVPNNSLVIQGISDFEEYSKYKQLINFKMQPIGDGASKEKKDVDVVIGTFQTLRELPDEFFTEFNVVTVDECLHPDTNIKMSDNTYKKINDIKINDIVLTYNETTNQIEHKKVEYVYKNLNKNVQMYELEMENGTTVKITGNHKVLLNNGLWKKVEDLNENDNIINI